MSNYIEYNDKIAFHPGYYIKEIIEESGLSQKDFAKRLDTTPKNLSILVRGEQSLSIDIAMKLSRMLGTSVDYWLNLQKSYDALIAEFESSKELEQERRIFKYFQYTYFRENFGMPDLPRKTNEQIKCLREFLNVASLSVFTKQNMAVSFRSASEDMKEANIARANAMVQIAINQALKIEAPKFEKKKFEKAVDYALTLTTQHGDFYPLIRQAFEDAGVIFVILPNLPGSGINGATKKIGQNVMLMVNDRRFYSDTFWFTLFHEIFTPSAVFSDFVKVTCVSDGQGIFFTVIRDPFRQVIVCHALCERQFRCIIGFALLFCTYAVDRSDEQCGCHHKCQCTVCFRPSHRFPP